MRICLVSTVFPPAIGGPSIQTFQLASALVRNGHQVTVVTTHHPKRGRDLVATMQGARLVEAGRVQDNLASKVRWNLAFARAVYQELSSSHYDILHCQTAPSLAGLLVGKVAQICQVPSFAKFPGDEVLQRVNKYRRICLDPAKLYTLNCQTRFWATTQLLAMRTYTLVWTNHSYDYNNLLNLFGFSGNRVCLFPNFQHISPSILSKSPSATLPPTIICPSRISALKGVDLLLQAYARLPADIRGEFWVIGDGIPQVLVELKRLVQEMALDKWVRFLGPVSPLAIKEYLKHASIYMNVLIHRYHGAGFVEALAAGSCIVAHNLGSWPQVADFENIPALVGNSVEETAGFLEQAIRDPDLRRQYAQQGREFVRRLDLNTHLDVFLRAYEQTIEMAHSGKVAI